MHLPTGYSSKGFSLIELLVVVSIMVTLLSIGVASYNSFNRTATLDGASKALRANMRLAQAYAVNGEKKSGTCPSPMVLQGYYVSFNLTAPQSYTLGQWCQDPNNSSSFQYTPRTPPSPITLPTGVTFSPAPSTNPLTVVFKSIRGIDIYSWNTTPLSNQVNPTPLNTTVNLCTGSPCSGSNIRTVTINQSGAVN